MNPNPAEDPEPPGTDITPPQLSPPNRELLEFVLESLERGDALDWDKLGMDELNGISNQAEFAQALDRYQGLLQQIRSARGQPFLAPGDSLGDFEVVELLARGGMGEVYRAKQKSLGGREVALKVLREDQRSPADLDRFQREAMLLSKLHHPNMAEVYGFGESGSHLFLAMRLIRGDSISRRTRSSRDPIASKRAVAWCIDVAKALTVVHATGLVHRDVKPSNVVLEAGSGKTEKAVLVDFGLVRPVQGLSRTTNGLAPLTAAYAAPEQLLGRSVDQRADVFSLGVLLHDLLTGTQPDQRGRAAGGLPDLPAEINAGADLCAVVAKATNPKPEARYQDSQSFLEDLEAWQAGRPVMARRHSVRERAHFYLKQHRSALFQWGLRVASFVMIVFLVSWTRSLNQRAGVVRAAASARDLPTLRRAYAGIPQFLESAVLRDKQALELAHRVSSDDGLDPIAQIADAFDRGEPLDALRTAASQLASVGPASAPVCLDLILQAIQESSSPKIRERAFLLLALALNENPSTDHSINPESRAILDLIHQGALLESGARSLQGNEQLYALTIRGAIGQIEEAEHLADEWLTFPTGTELMRLGTESLERMLRRSCQSGQQAAMLDRVRWRPILERIRYLRTIGPCGDWGYQVSQSRLVSEYFLACRREGREVDAQLALPAQWLSTDPIHWKGNGYYAPVSELAAAGDSRSSLFLASMSPGKRLKDDGRFLGRIAGLLPDPDLIVPTISRLVQFGVENEEARELVMLAFSEAQRDLESARIPADTTQDGGLLQNAVNQAPLHELDTRRPVESPDSATNKSTASWGFVSYDPPGLFGEAASLSARAASLFRENGAKPVLLFSTFGQSEVLLEIDHGKSELQEWSLSLFGQVSSRRYLPYQGIVRLKLFLDGLLVGTLSLSHVELRTDTFQIPAYWLSEGRHKLRILLSDESTSTYRLFHVRLNEGKAPSK